MKPPPVMPLPPLDNWTHAELRDLIRVLHGALTKADAAYVQLSLVTERAILMAQR